MRSTASIKCHKKLPPSNIFLQKEIDFIWSKMHKPNHGAVHKQPIRVTAPQHFKERKKKAVRIITKRINTSCPSEQEN